jgi:hypothetical protein
MLPLEQRDAGEVAGAVGFVLIFAAVYAACIPAFGVLLTLAVGWLPAAVAAVTGAHAIRFLFRALIPARSPTSPRL